MSIENPRSLASASADIRAKSALTQFPRTTIDAEGEYWVTAHRSPSEAEVRTYARATEPQAMKSLLVDDLGLSLDYADQAVTQAQRRGRFTSVDAFPAEVLNRLQEVFNRQLSERRRAV